MRLMMAFFTRCFANPDRPTAFFVVGLMALFAVPQTVCAAEDVSLKFAEIRAVNEGYELEAQFVLNPNRTLEDALEKGVALHFIAELEVNHPRSWWFNESIGEATRRMRIYYNLLLRRYVVDAGYVTQTAPTLDEALMILGRIEHWQVLERGALKPGRHYGARLRLRMDASQMAKPLQIGALTNARWDLQSAWFEWKFDAPLPSKPTPLLP
jgi:hypothetical protein